MQSMQSRAIALAMHNAARRQSTVLQPSRLAALCLHARHGNSSRRHFSQGGSSSSFLLSDKTSPQQPSSSSTKSSSQQEQQQKQKQLQDDTQLPSFDINALGLKPGTKKLVIVLLCVWATVETYFYSMWIYRWWKSRQEAQQLDGTS